MSIFRFAMALRTTRLRSCLPLQVERRGELSAAHGFVNGIEEFSWWFSVEVRTGRLTPAEMA
jgi:hypothetical protein